jgi:hypothetical protein
VPRGAGGARCLASGRCPRVSIATLAGRVHAAGCRHPLTAPDPGAAAHLGRSARHPARSIRPAVDLFLRRPSVVAPCRHRRTPGGRRCRTLRTHAGGALPPWRPLRSARLGAPDDSDATGCRGALLAQRSFRRGGRRRRAEVRALPRELVSRTWHGHRSPGPDPEASRRLPAADTEERPPRR